MVRYILPTRITCTLSDPHITGRAGLGDPSDFLNLSDASVDTIKHSLPEAKQKKFQEVSTRASFHCTLVFSHCTPPTVD